MAKAVIGYRVRGFEDPILFNPGDYGWWKRAGHWVAMTPTDDMANLASHQVTEHEDGTITVSPSILVSTSRNGVAVECWHGFLERGVWRSC